jgi:hypothetical protein
MKMNKTFLGSHCIPQLLIGRYDYCATPDEEYDLMIDKLRNQILKASPHARI